MKHYDYEISLLVEGELPEDKKEEILSHISTCEKCGRILRDYENIKDNIVQFYKILPDSGNEIKYGTTRPNSFLIKSFARKYIIPVSVSALVIFLLFFLVKINLRPSNMSIFTASKNELFSSDYNEISTFNRVINKALESMGQETIPGELRRAGSGNEQLKFNETINSALYSKYKY